MATSYQLSVYQLSVYRAISHRAIRQFFVSSVKCVSVYVKVGYSRN